MMMSFASDVITAPNAAPTKTPTASAQMFPLLKTRSIAFLKLESFLTFGFLIFLLIYLIYYTNFVINRSYGGRSGI